MKKLYSSTQLLNTFIECVQLYKAIHGVTDKEISDLLGFSYNKSKLDSDAGYLTTERANKLCRAFPCSFKLIHRFSGVTAYKCKQPGSLMPIVRKIVREYREGIGLSQRDVSNELGSSYSNFEGGSNNGIDIMLLAADWVSYEVKYQCTGLETLNEIFARHERAMPGNRYAKVTGVGNGRVVNGFTGW